MMLHLLVPLEIASGAQIKFMLDLARRSNQVVPTWAYLSKAAASRYIDSMTLPRIAEPVAG